MPIYCYFLDNSIHINSHLKIWKAGYTISMKVLYSFSCITLLKDNPRKISVFTYSQLYT